jgi:hypothetical protein
MGYFTRRSFGLEQAIPTTGFSRDTAQSHGTAAGLSMRYVIQCAGSKQRDAGSFRTANGRYVAFVADPAGAPATPGVLYAHPDDRSEPADSSSPTWRDLVTQANRRHLSNDCGLLPAGLLYTPSAYAELAEWAGADKLFILSAGWGLVRSDFLLPDYDITFSGSAEAFKRRKRGQRFRDFNELDDAAEEGIAFLGGKDYLPLFLALTASSSASQRMVFYNSLIPPQAPGCTVQAYPTKRRTNWHYGCAAELADGTLVLPTVG